MFSSILFRIYCTIIRYSQKNNENQSQNESNINIKFKLNLNSYHKFYDKYCKLNHKSTYEKNTSIFLIMLW